VVAKSVLSFLLFSVAALAAPAIGIVTASGHFNVEGSQVWGNATLFDGTTIETSSASSELALRNGVKVQLAAGSRARIWQNRLVLEKGIAQLAAPVSFEARVSDQAKLIRAPFRGVAMQAAQGQVVHAGCMVYKDGHFLVQDQATQEVIEVSGTDLAVNVGNRVEVRGAISSARAGVAPATSVMNVASVALVSQGGCLSVSATLDAKTEVPASTAAPTAAGAKPPSPSPSSTPAAHTGMSTGAKIGIVAAIGGGGAGAAIALAGGKKSTSQ
jgi:hypothetical protein